MPSKFSNTDRAALLRLASSLPVGDKDRQAILGALKTAADELDEKWKKLEKIMIKEMTEVFKSAVFLNNLADTLGVEEGGQLKKIEAETLRDMLWDGDVDGTGDLLAELEEADKKFDSKLTKIQKTVEKAAMAYLKTKLPYTVKG